MYLIIIPLFEGINFKDILWGFHIFRQLNIIIPWNVYPQIIAYMHQNAAIHENITFAKFFYLYARNINMHTIVHGN